MEEDLGNTIKIPLQYDNQFALVDEEDYHRVEEYTWCSVLKSNGVWYVKTGIVIEDKNTTLYLHQVILELEENLRVDHINGNGLDCRKANLRSSTASQNAANQGPSTRNTSGFKGVSITSYGNKYEARIKEKNKYRYLGRFNTAIEAAKAYDKEAVRVFGEFAWTNFDS